MTPIPHTVPRSLTVCVPLLMFNAFATPNQSAADATTLDLLGLVKLLSRLAVVLLLMRLLWKYRHDERFQRAVFHFIPLGLFALWAIFSSSWSALPKFSFAQATSFSVLVLLGINVAIATRNEASTSALLRQLSIALLALNTFIILLRLAAPSLCPLTRNVDGLVHPTSAAAGASLGVLILVASRLIWKWDWTRSLLLPALAVHSLLIVLAANRTSLALTLLLSLGLCCIYGDRLLTAAVVVCGCSLGALYITWDPNLDLASASLGDTAQYVKRGKADDLKDYSGRNELWGVMWNSYRESPWIGHGYFVSSAGGELYIWYTWANWTAHNLALQALVTTGAIGAALLTLGVLTPLSTFRNRHRVCPGAGAFVGVFVLWYAVWGQFNESFLGPVEADPAVFFVVLGIAAAQAKPPRKYPQSATIRAESPASSKARRNEILCPARRQIDFRSSPHLVGHPTCGSGTR